MIDRPKQISAATIHHHTSPAQSQPIDQSAVQIRSADQCVSHRHEIIEKVVEVAQKGNFGGFIRIILSATFTLLKVHSLLVSRGLSPLDFDAVGHDNKLPSMQIFGENLNHGTLDGLDNNRIIQNSIVLYEEFTIDGRSTDLEAKILRTSYQEFEMMVDRCAEHCDAEMIAKLLQEIKERQRHDGGVHDWNNGIHFVCRRGLVQDEKALKMMRSLDHLLNAPTFHCMVLEDAAVEGKYIEAEMLIEELGIYHKLSFGTFVRTHPNMLSQIKVNELNVPRSYDIEKMRKVFGRDNCALDRICDLEKKMEKPVLQLLLEGVELVTAISKKVILFPRWGQGGTPWGVY